MTKTKMHVLTDEVVEIESDVQIMGPEEMTKMLGIHTGYRVTPQKQSSERMAKCGRKINNWFQKGRTVPGRCVTVDCVRYEDALNVAGFSESKTRGYGAKKDN
jgi:hypothetical protein